MATISQKLTGYLTGGIIYMTGDTIAAIIQGEQSIVRSAGIFIIGATLYAFEIKTWFAWIEKKAATRAGIQRVVFKTGMALVYFNPLWVARHLCFIYLLSGRGSLISTGLLWTALMSFLVNIPISVLANYLIQNCTPLAYRFWASATFSALMAIYYSMSSVWF